MSLYRKYYPTMRIYYPTLAGLLVALVLPYFSPTLINLIPNIDAHPYLQRAGPWLSALLILAIVLFWERRPLSSIGLRRMSWQDVGWALAALAAGILTLVVTTPLIRALHLTPMGSTLTQQLAPQPTLVLLFTAVTAGITEELLYRGYLIERLSQLTGRLGWGAVIAYCAFVLTHLRFWGAGGMLQVGAWALVVTGLYVWRRNLGANMLMHVLNDTFFLVIAPLLLARYLH